MVEIIECKDLMGQSKNDFLNKGIAVKKKSSGGGGGFGGLAKMALKAGGAGGLSGDYDSLPRAKIWIEFEDVAELIRVAEIFGVKIINKRKKDYVFADAGSIYYAKE